VAEEKKQKLEDPITKEITDLEIEEWAIKNPLEAKEFGLRLISHAKTPEKIDALPSLGKFQDRMTLWAKKDPARAQMVLLKLLPKVMAAAALASAKKK
jgi:hypothetical protein